jgi:hypothetical protein
VTPRRIGLLVLVGATLGLGALLLERQRAKARAETLAQGERLYRQGLGSTGQPTKALVRRDLEVDGVMFACVSCHLRSGYGAAEGKIIAPPVDGESLFQPVKLRYKGVEIAGAPLRRPAYTRESLAQVLRTGVDPSGRTLDEAMPRYTLGEADLNALVEYLSSLGGGPSEGVTEGTIRLATVLTDEVPAAEREAFLFTLEKYVAFKNAQTQPRETGVDNRSARMATSMLLSKDVAFKRLVLTPWLLHGKPETWPEQLEAWYEASPPFALIGGLSTQRWEPIHQFCETKRLPTLLPLTDLPARSSATDTYTLYLNKGVAQEAEGVARYLASLGDAPAGVLQIVRDTPAGQALRAGFEETLRQLGQPAPDTVTVAPGAPIPEVGQRSPSAVVLWDGPEGLAALEGLTAAAPRVFVSATALGEALWTIDERLRERTWVAWPYRLPEQEERYRSILAPWLKGSSAPEASGRSGREYRIAAGAYAVTQVLTQALMDLRGRYSREYLLDVVGMLPDQRLPSFERLSFGVGLHTVANGCHLVQLGPGPAPMLVKRSEWLTH